MLIIVVSRGRAPVQTVVMVTPKDLLAACCENNLLESYEISSNRTSNVNGIRTQPPTKSYSSALSSRASDGTIR